MVDYRDIRKYSQMEDRELFETARNLRNELENPRLSTRDYINTLLIATIGPGSTIAALGGYIQHHRTDSKIIKPFGKHLNDSFDALQNRGFKGLRDYLESFGNFRRNLKVTVSTFAISSLLSLPLILGIQKREKAEGNAIKLTHVERILRERGYETRQGGAYVRKPHFDEKGNPIRYHGYPYPSPPDEPQIALS